MNLNQYKNEKQDIENYFSKEIKSRFKNYVDENYEIDLCADYETHEKINNILKNDGFEVYGMNINMDGFYLHLDFGENYAEIEGFPFTRLIVSFSNDGNYNVSLDEDAFSSPWEVIFEDAFDNYTAMTPQQLKDMIQEIKKVHLSYLLKMQD